MTEKPLSVLGQIKLPFLIDNKIEYFNIIVVEDKFGENMLLGRNFLRKFEGQILYSRDKCVQIKLMGIPYPCLKTTTSFCVNFVSSDNILNGAYSKAKFPIGFTMQSGSVWHSFVKVPNHLNHKTVYFESTDHEDIIMPRVVAVVKDGTIPVVAINLLDKVVVKKHNQLAGNVFIADDSQIIDSDLFTPSTGDSLLLHSSIPQEQSTVTGASASHKKCGIQPVIENEYLRVGYVNNIDSSNASDANSVFHNMIESVNLEHLPVDQQLELRKLLHHRRDAISVGGEIGHVRESHHKIILQKDTKPINTPQYKIPYHAKPIVQDHIQSLLDQDVIEKSRSPWNSPIILIKKPHSDEYRFCVDFRKLNAVTVKDTFPVPRTETVLDELCGAGIFTTLDIKSAYFNIELEKDSRPYTSFRTESGSYQFKRTPQGLSTSSAAYQRACNLLFSKHLGKFMFAFVADLIIYSRNWNEHMEHLNEVFDTIESSGFKIGFKKCQFAQSSVKYLGHIITKKGIRVDPNKVEAISTLPPPRTIKGIRSFVATAAYYRKFIKDFSKIAAPLTELTKKNIRFKWTQECQKAFDTLKDLLISSPVLAFPDYTKRFSVHTDASSIALGGSLHMKGDKGEQPIAYFSRKLKDTEKSYTTTELEALAIHDSIKYFSAYLWGTNFDIYTDHKALQFIFKNKNSIPRVARWSMLLEEYDYNIHYKKGKENSVPDCLSRRAFEEETVHFVSENQDITNTETLKLSQRNDPVWGEVIKYLEGSVDARLKKICNLDNLFIENGTLYRWVDSAKSSPYERLQIVVPKNLVRSALTLTHDTEISGHMGVLRTLHRAREKFYWPNMIGDVRDYVRTCLDCQKRKWQGQNVAPLGSFEPVDRPMARVGVDLIEMN